MHHGKRTYQCNDCKEVFEGISQVVRVKRNKTETIVKCKECDEKCTAIMNEINRTILEALA